MDDVTFVSTIQKYEGKPYALGDWSRGVDCLNIMLDFFESCGYSMPHEFKGWTRENYAKRWERGEGMDVFEEFLFSLGEPVDENYIQNGDIVILKKGGVVSAGIYVGAGHFQVVHNQYGVMRLPLRFFKPAIAGIRRVLKHENLET